MISGFGVKNVLIVIIIDPDHVNCSSVIYGYIRHFIIAAGIGRYLHVGAEISTKNG
jgi:hypothetical protein